MYKWFTIYLETEGQTVKNDISSTTDSKRSVGLTISCRAARSWKRLRCSRVNRRSIVCTLAAAERGPYCRVGSLYATRTWSSFLIIFLRHYSQFEGTGQVFNVAERSLPNWHLFSTSHQENSICRGDGRLYRLGFTESIAVNCRAA